MIIDSYVSVQVAVQTPGRMLEYVLIALRRFEMIRLSDFLTNPGKVASRQ